MAEMKSPYEMDDALLQFEYEGAAMAYAVALDKTAPDMKSKQRRLDELRRAVRARLDRQLPFHSPGEVVRKIGLPSNKPRVVKDVFYVGDNRWMMICEGDEQKAQAVFCDEYELVPNNVIPLP